MKRRLTVTASVLLFGSIFAFVWLTDNELGEQAWAEQSTAGSARIAEPTYSRLKVQAWVGDCKAAYKLGRHHVFFSLNANEAIRWYRLAAKCPHAAAKGELLGILMHFSAHDAEVDRLLAEIKELDPTSAENDRAAVESVRKSRE